MQPNIEVVDRAGRVIELADGVVPDGCRVLVSPLFMDGGGEHQAELNDKARKAYEERSRQMSDRWRRPKPSHAGPYGSWPDRSKPQWMQHDGGGVPAVGPGSRSPTRRAFADRREEAYAKMCERISNAWRDHAR